MRDYKKEEEARKSKYTIIRANIDNLLAQKFKDKLKKEGRTATSVINEAIINYLDIDINTEFEVAKMLKELKKIGLTKEKLEKDYEEVDGILSFEEYIDRIFNTFC